MMMNVLAPPSQGATSMASAVSFRLKYLRKQCNFIKNVLFQRIYLFKQIQHIAQTANMCAIITRIAWAVNVYRKICYATEKKIVTTEKMRRTAVKLTI